MWLLLLLLIVANIFLLYTSYPTVSAWLVLRNESFFNSPVSTGEASPGFQPLKMIKETSGQYRLAGPQSLTYGAIEHILFRPDVLSGEIMALDIQADQTRGNIVLRSLIFRRTDVP